MKRFLMISLVVLVLSGLIISGCAAPSATPKPAPTPSPAPAPAPAPVKPVEWKMATFLPVTSVSVMWGKTWADRVAQKSNGALKITVSGPEGIPRADQLAALNKGVVNAVVANSGMIAPFEPAIWCDILSDFNITEERTRGFYDYINTLFAKNGLYYLGSAMGNYERVIGLADKITNKEGLKDLKIRADEAYAPYFKALGCSVVFMPMGDVYTAMSQRVVVGYHAVVSDVTGNSLYEVSKYWIDHPLLGSRTQIMLNLQSLNALPANLRDLAIKTYLDMEPEIQKAMSDDVAAQRKTMMEKGQKMEPIKWSADDAKWLIDTYNNDGWEMVKKGVSPEVYAKLRQLKIK